jgi:hypothetical protein
VKEKIDMRGKNKIIIHLSMLKILNWI